MIAPPIFLRVFVPLGPNFDFLVEKRTTWNSPPFGLCSTAPLSLLVPLEIFLVQPEFYRSKNGIVCVMVGHHLLGRKKSRPQKLITVIIDLCELHRFFCLTPPDGLLSSEKNLFLRWKKTPTISSFLHKIYYESNVVQMVHTLTCLDNSIIESKVHLLLL